MNADRHREHVNGRDGMKRAPWAASGRSTPYRFGLLVMPNFSLIGLSSVADPLRLANAAAGRPVYATVTLSEHGGAVRSSDGIEIMAQHAIRTAPPLDALLVIGPNPLPTRGVRSVIGWLKGLAAAGIALGGVDTGSWFLARAGLLDGYRCTIHWEDMDALVDVFPKVRATTSLFEVDRDRCSCSGGIAAVDMMIHLIGLGPGSTRLATTVSDLLVCEHRGPLERQRVPLRGLVGPGQGTIRAAVTLMDANLDEPLAMHELAALLGVSMRQIERLFRDQLHCTPRQHYLEIRLARARQLLRRTDRPISRIAEECGFASLPHFTNRYRARFGRPPGLDRRSFGPA